MKIKMAKINQVLEYTYLLILGIIGFSRMSQYVIFNLLHLPFYLIEIFFLPFFLYSYKEYSKYLVRLSRTKRFGLWVIYLTILVLLGCAVSMDVVDTVTMSRSLVYIVLIALIFDMKKKFTVNKLFIVSLGGIIGEFIFGTRYFGGDIASINTSCLAIMLIVPIIKKRYLLFAGCSILGLLVSINSGYRIGIIVLILVLAECVFWIVFVNEERTLRNTAKKVFVPVIILVLAGWVAFNYQSFIQFASSTLGASQYAIFRVTQRLQALFTRNWDQSHEQLRFEVFRYAITSFLPSIFPKGLVGKTMGTLHYYYDVPIVYLYDAFGSIAAYIIAGICSIKGFRCFIGAFKKEMEDYYILSGLMFPVLFMCLLTNGSFVYITFQCITTGIFLGEWFAYDKEHTQHKQKRQRRVIDYVNNSNHAD